MSLSMTSRIRIIHGVLQLIADEYDYRILHVKGPTLSHDVLSPGPGESAIKRAASSDADVFVHPADVEGFLRAVKGPGWIQKTQFADGSAFTHAVNIYHPTLGNADVHRSIPGLNTNGFDVLWEDRTLIELGHVSCATPSIAGQRLVLALHGARSGPHHNDRWFGWHGLNDDQRDEVRTLAREAGAEIVIALLEDRLEDFSSHPDYLLWKHFGEGHTSRLSEWKARWHAATTIPMKVDVVRAFLFMSDSVLENELGRVPTRRERLHRQGQRFVHLGREVHRRLRGLAD